MCWCCGVCLGVCELCFVGVVRCVVVWLSVVGVSVCEVCVWCVGVLWWCVELCVVC